MHPSPSLINAVCDELKAHAPFDLMAAEHLRWLVERLSLRYFARGSVVLSPGDSPVPVVFIVQRGEITGLDPQTVDADRAAHLHAGEMFPIGAAVGQRATVLQYLAASDTFCYQLSVPDFEHLMDVSRPFRHFATARLSHLLDQSRKLAQSDVAHLLRDSQRMSESLSTVIQRAPIFVSPHTEVRSALALMRREQIGALVVVDEKEIPVGVFTERDVLQRVALEGFDQSIHISHVMTENPICLPEHASAFDAAKLMTERRFRHMLVTRESRLLGVVSERDLFGRQQLSVGTISKAISRAQTPAELASSAAAARKVSQSLTAQGVATEHIVELITTLNDALVVRSIELATIVSRPPDTHWCWLGLGSEGRMEQTLATDQDNAIVFMPIVGEEEATTRLKFVEFAARVNQLLADCGIPLCQGDIMASNPRWCLSVSEWRSQFAAWMRDLNPSAILNAAIFFDFRPLYGAAALASDLRGWLTETAANENLFLRLMAENAVQTKAPLNLLGGFVDDSEVDGAIDLKRHAVRPFVDSIRVLALAHHVPAVSSVGRLRALAHPAKFAHGEVSAIIEAFQFIQSLRLRPHSMHAHADTQALVRPNYYPLAQLNLLDRRILKEVFRLLGNLQARVGLDFRL